MFSLPFERVHAKPSGSLSDRSSAEIREVSGKRPLGHDRVDAREHVGWRAECVACGAYGEP
jgi:hypothetical protein